jgi:tRNA(His) 5'-end guanylyltransferase
LSISAKNEYLFQHGINFNELPAWQKRGSGVYWQTLEKTGFNPKTCENIKTQRRELWVNTELPVKEMYANWLAQSFLN